MHLLWWLWMLLKESVVQNWQGWWIAESGFWFDWWQACAENRLQPLMLDIDGHGFHHDDDDDLIKYIDTVIMTATVMNHDNVQDISIQFHAIFWENLAFSEDSKAAKPHLMMRWFAAVSGRGWRVDRWREDNRITGFWLQASGCELLKW